MSCSLMFLTLCDPRDCVAHQAPLSMEFSKQEYWSRLLLPSPGDLPDPGMEPASPASPVLAGGFFTTEPPGKPSLTFSSKFILLSHAHHEGHSMHTLLNITEQWLGISETFMASLKGTKISDHCFLFSQVTVSLPCYATPLTHIVMESAPPPISYSNFHNKKAFWELGMPATAHRGLFFSEQRRKGARSATETRPQTDDGDGVHEYTGATPLNWNNVKVYCIRQ